MAENTVKIVMEEASSRRASIRDAQRSHIESIRDAQRSQINAVRDAQRLGSVGSGGNRYGDLGAAIGGSQKEAREQMSRWREIQREQAEDLKRTLGRISALTNFGQEMGVPGAGGAGRIAAAGAMGGPWGAAAAAAGEGLKKANNLPGEVLARAQELAPYNPALAQAQANAQAGALNRTIREAERLGEAMAKMVEQQEAAAEAAFELDLRFKEMKVDMALATQAIKNLPAWFKGWLDPGAQKEQPIDNLRNQLLKMKVPIGQKVQQPERVRLFVPAFRID